MKFRAVQDLLGDSTGFFFFPILSDGFIFGDIFFDLVVTNPAFVSLVFIKGEVYLVQVGQIQVFDLASTLAELVQFSVFQAFSCKLSLDPLFFLFHLLDLDLSHPSQLCDVCIRVWLLDLRRG